MSVFQAGFLGLIQGITEFLPVSSSGHLVIAQKLLGFSNPPIFFDVLVHFATLLAVVIFFRRAIFALNFQKILLLILGTIPTGIIGLILNQYKENLFNSLYIVSFGLLITSGLLLLSHRKLTKKPKSQLTYLQSLIIGTIQGVAIIPGVSRSGSTISQALILGISRESAFEFSFLLSIPAIIAAQVLELKNLNFVSQSFSPLVLIVGTTAAFTAGIISLYLLKKALLSKRFHLFSVYTLSLAILTGILASI